MRRKYRRMRERFRQSLSYWIGLAEMEFTKDLDKIMQEEGISRAELARRINSSPAYVTKALGGNQNFTLQTMAKLALAMDAVLHIRIAREGEIVQISSPVTANVSAAAPDAPAHSANSLSGIVSNETPQAQVWMLSPASNVRTPEYVN